MQTSVWLVFAGPKTTLNTQCEPKFCWLLRDIYGTIIYTSQSTWFQIKKLLLVFRQTGSAEWWRKHSKKALTTSCAFFFCILSIWEGGGAREPSPMAAEMSGRLSEKIETLKRSLYYVVWGLQHFTGNNCRLFQWSITIPSLFWLLLGRLVATYCRLKNQSVIGLNFRTAFC